MHITPESSRRHFCQQLLGTLVGAVAVGRAAFAQTKPALIVYKDPSCGCCGMWIDYMQARGYKVTVYNKGMTEIKAQLKIPPALQSCHTTMAGGYVIEGHVPAPDIEKLLAQKPKNIIGLTIPGMPASAPGMDQKPFRPYTVLTFDAKGATTVFAVHDKPPA